MRRMIETLLLAVVLSAGGAACKEGSAKQPAPRAIEIEALTIEPRDVRDTGEYLGSLLSRDSVRVLPQVAGYVRKIHVRPGDRVEAGQPLLDVDARMEAAALESAKAQKSSAAAQLELARQTQKRAAALYREGLATAEEVERARADVESLAAAARVAAAAVSQRKVQLQYHVIRAPVPGAIGDVMVRVGDYVTASTPLTTISESKVLELTVSVPTHRARQIEPNTPVEILGRDGEVMLTSMVFFVAPEADPQTQLVEVKAVVENSVDLRPSELVRARVVYTTREALQIPVLAVVRQSGQAFAFVVFERDGKTLVERRPITLGELGEQTYVVRDGLKPGDRIAVSAIQKLRDGSVVRLRGPSAADRANGRG